MIEEQILEELKKLNKNMDQILCVQKLQAERWKQKNAPSIYADVGQPSATTELEK